MLGYGQCSLVIGSEVLSTVFQGNWLAICCRSLDRYDLPPIYILTAQDRKLPRCATLTVQDHGNSTQTLLSRAEKSVPEQNPDRGKSLHMTVLLVDRGKQNQPLPYTICLSTLTASAATSALLMPTWGLRNRNCRFKLLISIVSMSTCKSSRKTKLCTDSTFEA